MAELHPTALRKMNSSLEALILAGIKKYTQMEEEKQPQKFSNEGEKGLRYGTKENYCKEKSFSNLALASLRANRSFPITWGRLQSLKTAVKF